jgi:hypothetical protein
MKSILRSFHFVYLLEIQQNHHAEYMGPSYMDANPLQMVQRYIINLQIHVIRFMEIDMLHSTGPITSIYWLFFAGTLKGRT